MNKVLALHWFPSKYILGMATVMTPKGTLLDIFASNVHTKWAEFGTGDGDCEIDVCITNLTNWNQVLNLPPISIALIDGADKCLVVFDLLIRYYEIDYKRLCTCHIGPLNLN